jgi:hypothetical protein
MIPIMFLIAAVLFSGAVAASAPAPTPPTLYRLELSGGGSLWAKDAPMQSGGLVTFHRYPDGVLVSIRRSDLLRVAVTKPEPTVVRALSAGAAVDIGITGGGSAAGGRAGTPARAGVARSGGSPKTNPALGETKEGKALFNPDRDYKPEWDSRQVPGLNLANPNSPNDYTEGRTLAYPPAPVTQSAPGDVPRAKVETGEPPKGPQ